MGLSYLEVAPIFKPGLLRDLMKVFGEPFMVKFAVRGEEISREAVNIGELEGVRLKDRYVGGVPVYLEGKAPISRILEIYERQYEHFRLRFEKGLREARPPRIWVEEIIWYKWGKEGYRVKFGEYRLEVEIAPEEEGVIGNLIKCAKKHDVAIRITLNPKC